MIKMSTAGCADKQEKDPVAFGRGCELRDEQKEDGQGGGSAGSSSSSKVWTRKPHKLWTRGGVHQPVDHAWAFASDGGISSHRLSRQAERLGRETRRL